MKKSELEELEKPNRVLHPTFKATEIHSGNECPRCFTEINTGDTVRYSDENELVHAMHRHPEIKYDICDSCFLTKPCECDED